TSPKSLREPPGLTDDQPIDRAFRSVYATPGSCQPCYLRWRGGRQNEQFHARRFRGSGRVRLVELRSAASAPELPPTPAVARRRPLTVLLGRSQHSPPVQVAIQAWRMSNPFFERPILNSPYERPRRHWELDETGQPTQQILETRRLAQFITPI